MTNHTVATMKQNGANLITRPETLRIARPIMALIQLGINSCIRVKWHLQMLCHRFQTLSCGIGRPFLFWSLETVRHFDRLFSREIGNKQSEKVFF
jgi:hypothetical protein